MQKGLLFITLNTFSSTGGIEKVCRVAGKALSELAAERGSPFTLVSMHDRPTDLLEEYIPKNSFRAFSGNRGGCIMASIRAGRRADVVILAHVNLLVIGYAIKMVSPKTKVILLAHGIELWSPLPFWKGAMLAKLDRFLPVSTFTAKKLGELFAIPDAKMTVLNNCLDPFLKRSFLPSVGEELRTKYRIAPDDLLLFTLTRIKFSEQYKGYDRVIAALPTILKKRPRVKYLLAGKYDNEEKARLDKLIRDLSLEDAVIFTGFATDSEVHACFTAADMYIMPSTGEGFGIVFIEALFYGLPVIAGNRDGSVDALAGGGFGLLIDPLQEEEIVSAVLHIAENTAAYTPDHEAVMAKFGYEAYKSAIKKIISAAN